MDQCTNYTNLQMFFYILWILLKTAAVVAGYRLLKWTQNLIKERAQSSSKIFNVIQQNDYLLELTYPINRYLHDNWHIAKYLLTVSSAIIDMYDITAFMAFILFDVYRPVVHLGIVFTLRQICQFTCSLPLIDNIIWKSPQTIPSLVTYDVSNDFFFSGHTATVVLAALWMNSFGMVYGLIGILMVLFEIIIILSLRVHYTMDIYAGLMTSCVVYLLI